MADDSNQGETSESGQPIYRHRERTSPREFAAGNEQNINAIDKHIAQYLGPVETVLHEIVSELVHVDVHLVPPHGDRDWITLVTSGMSDRPMNAPADYAEFRHAELLISLPREWPLSADAFVDEAHYWPVRWLKTLARFPHEYDTWLWSGHTVPNGDPPEPYAPGVPFCCMMLFPSVLAPDEFMELHIPGSKKKITFFNLIPLYREEMEFKLKEGCDALLDKLAEVGVGEVIDVARPNACSSRRWF